MHNPSSMNNRKNTKPMDQETKPGTTILVHKDTTLTSLPMEKKDTKPVWSLPMEKEDTKMESSLSMEKKDTKTESSLPMEKKDTKTESSLPMDKEEIKTSTLMPCSLCLQFPGTKIDFSHW